MNTRTNNEPPEGSLTLSPRSGAEPSAAPSSSEPDRSGQRIGPFLLRKKLGQGGMGVVYLAEDARLRRQVALKILPAAVASRKERRRRFLREARSASAVMHPNIAAVFEVGEDGADLFLAMEYIEGQTLRARIQERGGPLALPEALRIARDIARGLQRAHRAGIIHRDLKPENVMITSDGLAKILDFGLATFDAPVGGELLPFTSTESALITAEGQILGTPGYMPPEQGRGLPTDGRADIFAFGVTLYEALAGVQPFPGATAIERLIAVERDVPALPSAHNPEVPPALDRLVARCIEKLPEDRFARCEEILAALDGLLIEAPPLARRPSAPPAPPLTGDSPRRAPRVSALPRRRRAVLLSITAVGALPLIAGLARVATRHAEPAKTAAAPPSASPAAAALPSASPVPASSAAAPENGAHRRPCLEVDAGFATCTAKNRVAWCDPSGRPLGCCGVGLILINDDGVCGCAPGGTSLPEAIARGCPAAAAGYDDAFARVKRAAMERAIDCFTPLIEQQKVNGGEFAAAFFLTPAGEVFGARVTHATLPHEEAQACALDALRATRFPPPRAEDISTLQGFGFEFSSRDELNKRRR